MEIEIRQTNQAEPQHKIMLMDAAKRERVIRAAMKEFARGYKNASTDIMVREAGISKGLLFHYFNTKKELFIYLHEFVQKIVRTEFLNAISLWRRDILERWRQVVILKIVLIHKYPDLFTFLAADNRGEHDEDIIARYKQNASLAAEVYTKIFTDVDFAYFRNDIDIHKAMDVITYTMDGFIATESEAQKEMDVNTAEYHRYNNEADAYIHLMRKFFYKGM